MKNIYKLLPILFVAFLISCDGGDGNGGDDPQPEITMADKKLEANKWNLVSVSSSDGDITSLFSGFTVTFSGGSYTTTNAVYGTWGSSGTYSYSNVSENGLSFSLDNGNTGSVFSFNGDQVTITVTVNSTILDGGRVSSLAGNYDFVLKK